MIRFKKTEGNLKQKLPGLVEVFKRNPKVSASYLFGSYVKDEIKPLSDIDIAVLLKNNISRLSYWDLKIGLLNKAIQILATEEIDFVLLNEAPYELAYNILKSGKILFCRDEKSLIEFKERIVLNYLDTQALREEGFFHLLERIRKGRFGDDKGRYKEDFEGIRRVLGEIKTYS